MNEPDIVVSTPAALLNNLDPKRRHRTDFIRSVKYVVCSQELLFLFLVGYSGVRRCKYPMNGRFLMKQICCSVEVSRIRLSGL